MANDLRPVETGNARNIKEVSLPVMPLVLLRYSAIAEFYSEEPMNMRIKVKEDDEDLIEAEQVFRIRIWIPNTKLISWSIYSENREWIDDVGANSPIILRKVVWEQGEDIKRIRSAVHDREKFLFSWPLLNIKNTFVDSHASKKLVEMLMKFDQKLNKGFNLHERDNKLSKTFWSDFELMRRFNWGQIHFTWDNSLCNKTIEDYSLLLGEQFEELINLTERDIYQMDLDYSYPTEEFKTLIQGRKTNF